jgi:hypothetical protein
MVCFVRQSALGWVVIALLLAASLASCVQDRIGPDRDGDGLTDRQERRFGTDPDNPDTNRNGILDGRDPTPWVDETPVIELTAGTPTAVGTEYYVPIAIRLVSGRGDVVSGAEEEIEATTNLGRLTPVAENGHGDYRTELITPTGGVATVIVSYRWMGHDETLKNSIVVEVAGEDDLPQPGVNPGPYAGAGALDGSLRVITVQGDSTGWAGLEPAPFGGAFVQVDLHDGDVIRAETDAQGVLLIEDERLTRPVTITVGAEGARYVTYVDLDAANLVVPVVPFDPVPGRDDDRAGALTGRVIGFEGECGLEPFPRENRSLLGWVNVAMVQVALRNVPLSSVSAGSVLEPPRNVEGATSFDELVPSNMVLHGGDLGDQRYRIGGLRPGRYLVFALAGEATNVLETIVDPYRLIFLGRALGIEEVEVRAGQEVEKDLVLCIDLIHGAGVIEVDLGAPPPDPMTGAPLPNLLMLPVFDTGKGFIFVDINGAYNQANYQNPTPITFPDPGDLEALGLGFRPLVVGLAGRSALNGADPPGIATVIRQPWPPPARVDFADPGVWPRLPRGVAPAPRPSGAPLDSVAGELTDGRIAWEIAPEAASGDGGRPPDLYAVRVNYMVSAPRNPFRAGFSIGGPSSRVLWELFVPGERTEIRLPQLPADAPNQPVLRNPAPSTGGANTPFVYPEDALEVEINAYYMGAHGKSFDFSDDFLMEDLNLHSSGVSQDSYMFRAP